MRCPSCRKTTASDHNPWRPFCSERCQLIDLGQWLSEGYRISVDEDEADEDGDTDTESDDLI